MPTQEPRGPLGVLRKGSCRKAESQQKGCVRQWQMAKKGELRDSNVPQSRGWQRPVGKVTDTPEQHKGKLPNDCPQKARAACLPECYTH